MNEVIESVREIVTSEIEAKTNVDYALASADGVSKVLTVATISAALIGELVVQKIRETD